MSLRVYWEFLRSGESWVPSTNVVIGFRRRFDTVAEAVEVFLMRASVGQVYRLVRDDGVPLFEVRGFDLVRCD